MNPKVLLIKRFKKFCERTKFDVTLNENENENGSSYVDIYTNKIYISLNDIKNTEYYIKNGFGDINTLIMILKGILYHEIGHIYFEKLFPRVYFEIIEIFLGLLHCYLLLVLVGVFIFLSANLFLMGEVDKEGVLSLYFYILTAILVVYPYIKDGIILYYCRINEIYADLYASHHFKKGIMEKLKSTKVPTVTDRIYSMFNHEHPYNYSRYHYISDTKIKNFKKLDRLSLFLILNWNYWFY